MNKWFIRIIAGVLIIGAFAGVGFAGYRVGLSQGMRIAGTSADRLPPFVERFHKDEFPRFHSEIQRFDRPFDRGFGPAGFHNRGFGLISPLFGLLKVAVVVLIAWGVYKLFTSGSWQLSFTRHPAETTSDRPTAAEKKPRGKQ